VPVRDRLTNDIFWRVELSPVVVRDGIAFVCTNVGLMAAVRTADLGLVWGFRYHRRDSPESEKFARDCLYLTGGWLGRPPVVLADRVVATPSDSNYAYVFARWPDARGDLVLNEPIQREERMALVGADAQSLYFVQRTGDAGAPRWFIEATDHDGVTRWSSVKLPAGERFAGVPVLTRRHLFVATDHVIYPIVLAREGSFYDRPIGLPERVGQPPPEVAGFGDLAVSGRYLSRRRRLHPRLRVGEGVSRWRRACTPASPPSPLRSFARRCSPRRRAASSTPSRPTTPSASSAARSSSRTRSGRSSSRAASSATAARWCAGSST
jgi:hypothetical protein